MSPALYANDLSLIIFFQYNFYILNCQFKFFVLFLSLRNAHTQSILTTFSILLISSIFIKSYLRLYFIYYHIVLYHYYHHLIGHVRYSVQYNSYYLLTHFYFIGHLPILTVYYFICNSILIIIKDSFSLSTKINHYNTYKKDLSDILSVNYYFFKKYFVPFFSPSLSKVLLATSLFKCLDAVFGVTLKRVA